MSERLKEYKKINIDWEKIFQNLIIDTSKIKNFLRLDWTKKSRERKDRYKQKS